ncbi:MAG: DUF480 domain-containing protein [Puniceicoccaceae bacterium]|nr:MAG: DUF480 domain-containing protein [Puniceicoccaceae bacterium]
MNLSTSADQPPHTANPLDPVEARVLGVLLEKEVTTPDTYPLSLNAVILACNQKSNRHPLMELAEPEVGAALDALRRRHLVVLFAGAEARVPKFRHTLEKVYPVESADQAILCELLLRGPQTPGELRHRCERLHPFDSLDAIHEAIDRLANRAGGPLVARLERRPGQKEARFAQTLTGPHVDSEEPATATTPLKAVLALPPEVEARLASLEAEVAALRSRLDAIEPSLEKIRDLLE